ncbi:MAG TPA: CcmD family protein [Bacteroidia bacterium]|nr:CcmD family protein [Bacteroidia bacterium]HQF27860.1 CcmD family protein [Bacteroidia bacterium]HQK97111.1 CcmD family protein [Bacteroidia bacterium]
MKNKSLIFSLLFVIMNLAAQAQNVEMADTMRSNGKIFVVVVVAAVVSIVLSIYMISIDKKVSKLEKKINESK